MNMIAAKSPGPDRERPPRPATSAAAPLRIGAVALVVRDLEAVARFYEQAIGLDRIEAAPGSVRLGAGGTVLLELRHDPEAPLARKSDPGLFHTAFLLPSRDDLGRWLLHATSQGVRISGASDHRVSEALYLSDPEGNGIELYADRPSDTWAWKDGLVDMTTAPLDLRALVRPVWDRGWTGMPADTRVGHVHLQVGDLDEAERFYGGLLGLDIVSRYRGATFFSSGGYHHHVAANVWNSAGAPARQAAATGLASVELVAADADVWSALRDRAGPAAESAPGVLRIADPWGTTLVVTSGDHQRA